MPCVTRKGWLGYPVSMEWDVPCHWVEFLSFVVVTHHLCCVNCVLVQSKSEITSSWWGFTVMLPVVILYLSLSYILGHVAAKITWQLRASICSQTVMCSTNTSSHCRMKMATLLKLSMVYQLTKIIRHSQFRYQIFNLSFPLKCIKPSCRQC